MKEKCFCIHVFSIKLRLSFVWLLWSHNEDIWEVLVNPPTVTNAIKKNMVRTQMLDNGHIQP